MGHRYGLNAQKCVSGKRCYETEMLAVEALIQHHIVNDYKGITGPINIYQCLDCGMWHFTSKGEKHALFDDEDTLSYIKKERRAYQWEKGIK
ncbi:MAG: hypothetical protein AAF616_10670 [Bacteroidota bacterium]